MQYIVLIDEWSVEEGDVEEVRFILLKREGELKYVSLRAEHRIYKEGSVSGGYKWLPFARWLVETKGFEVVPESDTAITGWW